MLYLNKLSSDAMQSVIIPAIDGKNALCVFRYLPTQRRWMIDITYGDFVLKKPVSNIWPKIVNIQAHVVHAGHNVTFYPELARERQLNNDLPLIIFRINGYSILSAKLFTNDH